MKVRISIHNVLHKNHNTVNHIESEFILNAVNQVKVYVSSKTNTVDKCVSFRIKGFIAIVAHGKV